MFVTLGIEIYATCAVETISDQSGLFLSEERADASVPSAKGAILLANYNFQNNMMVSGRLGWSEGAAPIANLAVNAGVLSHLSFSSILPRATPIAGYTEVLTTALLFFLVGQRESGPHPL